MNKSMRILLSIMIVFLIALVIPLKIRGENVYNELLEKQIIDTNVIESDIAECTEEEETINFEIDASIKEMNQKMEEIESIEDKEEWFIAYKNIINEYYYIIDPPETIYDYFTDEELDLLFHVVQAEIGDEYSFEQKVNVCSVIFNRLEHERFPDSLLEILTPYQFQPISDNRYKEVEVSEDTILACEYAFTIQDTTNGCLFFDSNNTLNYQFVFSDEAHNFYKCKED